MSESLNEALDALFTARIPGAWLKRSWKAATLGSWWAGLLARHEQLAKWLTGGRPKSFWMTGFFNPQVLLRSPALFTQMNEFIEITGTEPLLSLTCCLELMVPSL